MHKMIAAALLGATLANTAAATPPQRKAPAKRAAARAEPAACAALHNDYELASKKLAMNWAQGVTDNSAARATMRSTQDGVVMEQARVTMDLLRANGCKAPTAAPAKGAYEMQAMQCHTASLQAQTAAIFGRGGTGPVAECDMAQWTRQ